MRNRILALFVAFTLLLTGCAGNVPVRSAARSASVASGAEESTPVPEENTSVPEESASAPERSIPEPETSAAPEESAPTPEESVPVPETSAAAAERSVAPEDSAPDTAPLGTPAEQSAAPQPAQTAKTPEPGAIPKKWDKKSSFQYTLCFTGDINLAEGQYTTAALDSDGLKSCVSKTLRREMRRADVLCVNNEFSYTTRGEPLEGKAFTFRANPARTAVLRKLGADVAILANNHVFDYGEEGLGDTLDALDEAGIARIGAGRNLKEAAAIHYEKLDHCTVAYIAATRVEWSAQTRPATKEGMGVFQTAFDTDLLYKQVKKAKKKADFVVVCMHWGIEGTADLEDYQTQVGEGLVKAGADLIVGDHPHQLQGVKWVKKTPVFYSLGNFWFNRREEYTMLLKAELSGDKYGLRRVRYYVVPAWQANAKVKYLTEPEQQRAMYDYLSALPGSNIRVSDSGRVKKKT